MEYKYIIDQVKFSLDVLENALKPSPHIRMSDDLRKSYEKDKIFLTKLLELAQAGLDVLEGTT